MSPLFFVYGTNCEFIRTVMLFRSVSEKKGADTFLTDLFGIRPCHT